MRLQIIVFQTSTNLILNVTFSIFHIVNCVVGHNQRRLEAVPVVPGSQANQPIATKQVNHNYSKLSIVCIAVIFICYETIQLTFGFFASLAIFVVTCTAD